MSIRRPASRHPDRHRDRRPVHRISGPAELLQAVPYLLGFHPRRSLVLLGLHDGMLVVTARLDLDDAAHAVPSTVETLVDSGSQTLIAAVYDGRGDDAADDDDDADDDEGVLQWADVIEAVGAEATRRGARLADAVAVHGRRWSSYLCADERCCPPGGSVLPESTPTFVAEATLAGRVPLADRAAVEALLDPIPEPDSGALASGLADAENAAVAAALAGGGGRHERAQVRALFAAARASDAVRWRGVDTAQVARFGAALGVIAVRDAVWMGVDDSRIDGRALWRELARRLPPPYCAAPAFLFGWASWRAGDGALAGIAADRAIAADPSYTAADLLNAAVTRGVDPRRLPRLRLPRPA